MCDEYSIMFIIVDVYVYLFVALLKRGVLSLVGKIPWDRNDRFYYNHYYYEDYQ